MAVCERKVKRRVHACVHGCVFVYAREITRARAQACGKEGVFCVNVSELERKCGGEGVGVGVGVCVSEYVRVHLPIWQCYLQTHHSLPVVASYQWMSQLQKKFKHTQTHKNAPSLAALYTDYRAAAAEAVYLNDLNDLNDPLHAARATSSDLNLYKRAQRVVELELGMIVLLHTSSGKGSSSHCFGGTFRILIFLVRVHKIPACTCTLTYMYRYTHFCCSCLGTHYWGSCTTLAIEGACKSLTAHSESYMCTAYSPWCICTYLYTSL